MKPDSVMIAIDTVTLATAKNLRTRALATSRLRPATRMPVTMAIRAVLVCVRISMVPPASATSRATRPPSYPQSQSTTTSPVATAA